MLVFKAWSVHVLTCDIKVWGCHVTSQALTMQCYKTQHCLRDCSNHAIPLLPQIIPLSPFIAGMLKLKILQRMHLNVVYFELCSSANQLWMTTLWQLNSLCLYCQMDDPSLIGVAALGWETLKLLRQWWCNHDERFQCHLFSNPAL